MDLHHSFGFLVNKLAHMMMIQLEKQLKDYNVTTSQWAILAILWKREGIFQVDLQKSLGLDKATVTGLLQRMNSSGLIVKKADLNDKRVRRVYLTEHGRSLETFLIPRAAYVNDLTLASFTPEERELFIGMLKKGIQSIDMHS